MSTQSGTQIKVGRQSIKPRVFVGSSVESLHVAYAVQENLEYVAEVTVWTQGIFQLTRPTINSLLRALDSFDFAVFVFAPDDLLKIRDETVKAVRDNVIFELGLFMGALGEDRTFIITPRGSEDLHLPTDLTGITPATYEPNRRDQNLNAALGPTDTRISKAMQSMGPRLSSDSNQETLSTTVTNRLAEELKLELAQLLRGQDDRISEAFAQFEQRLVETSTAQRETAKAPNSRILRIVLDELSPTAKALLTELANNHITFEQYTHLSEDNFKETLDELRRHNLLEPVAARGKGQEPIFAYWFSARNHMAIRSAIEQLPKSEESISSKVQTALKKVGYIN